MGMCQLPGVTCTSVPPPILCACVRACVLCTEMFFTLCPQVTVGLLLACHLRLLATLACSPLYVNGYVNEFSETSDGPPSDLPSCQVRARACRCV